MRSWFSDDSVPVTNPRESASRTGTVSAEPKARHKRRAMSANPSISVDVTPSTNRTFFDRYSVDVIQELDGLRRLSVVWNSLLRDSQSMTVFLTWEWLEAWAECFLKDDRTLFVLCVWRGEKLIGIAPWYIQRARRGAFSLREVRFLGSPESGADYLDVILKKGKERVVAETLYKFLFGPGRQEWDELRLSDVPAESLFLLNFLNALESRGKFVELRRHAYLPQIPLPNTSFAFFSSLSSHRRRRVRQDMRRLANEQRFDHVIFSDERTEAGLTRFFALYDKLSGYDDGPRLARFLKALGAKDDASRWIQVELLTVGQRDVAGLLYLRFRRHVAVLKMVSDKGFSRQISVGNLLISMSIERAIENGMLCYDFLKGDENYKFHWARGGRATVCILMPQERWKSQMMAVYRLAKYAAKAVLR
jgi:CelD/BcsL family acetyltransferase involved in cellulose biosynthesis